MGRERGQSPRLKPLLAVWRDAVCNDADLTSTAKLTALTISTNMDASGYCWPGIDEIARKASLSDRSVQLAIRRQLEPRGYFEVSWSKGGSPHRYSATLPPTANDIHRAEWERVWTTAKRSRRSRAVNGETDAPNGERRSHDGEDRSPESAESAESVRGGAPGGARAAGACPECEMPQGRHTADCWRNWDVAP